MDRRGQSSFQPSGEDANPLNRRLPAEVVSRRKRPEKEEEEVVNEAVRLDLKYVLAQKPEARVRWLGQALRFAEQNRASAIDLYNTLTNKKFVQNLPPNIGSKMASTLRPQLRLFTDKQQRVLRDGPLLSAFKDDGDSDDGAKNEEMMARCRDFVREKAVSYGQRMAQVDDMERRAQRGDSGSDMDAELPPPGPPPDDAPPPPPEPGGMPVLPELSEAERKLEAQRKKREREAADAALLANYEQNMAEAENRTKQKQFAAVTQMQMQQAAADVDNALMMLERKQRSPSPQPGRTR